jgi:glycine cleavage system regulatory protein
VLIGVRVAPPVFHWIERRARSDGTVIGLALAFALGFAQLAELAGLAAIVGAFVAGVVLARSRTRQRIGSSLAPIGHVFVPVFFLTIGIDADVGAFLHPRVLLLALLLFAVGAVGKVLAGLAASGTGMDRLLVGLGMLPRGEVGLIFASFGLRLGVIGEDVYGALLLVVLATTFVTPPLLRWSSARHGWAAAAVQPAGPGQGGTRELEVRGGVVELADEPDKAPAGTRAALGLRAARLVAGARPGPRLRAWLEEGGAQPVVWSRPLKDELFALLRAGSSGSWDFLERTGLLAWYLPEIARLREALADRQAGRPWDRLARLAYLLHSRRDAAAAAAWLALPAPDDLLLAGLARAVGEGAHAGRVRAAARRTAERLGLGAADQQAVALLVGADADLAELAVRTDLHDEEQVLEIAARLGSPEQARMAYLLALAEQDDGEAWQGWRRALLDELLRLVLAAMAEPGLTDRAAENLMRRRRAEAERALNGAGPDAAAWLAAAPRRYLLAQPAEAIARHAALATPAPRRRELRLAISPEPETPGAWTIDVVTLDRPGLLARLTGALSACRLDITRAQASTWPDDLVVGVFHVTGPTVEADPSLPDRVEAMLRRSMAGGLDTARALARPDDARTRTGPVVVQVDAGASPWHSTVRVDAPDRPGLLYEILVQLAHHHVDVQVARVGGEAGRAVDVFFVTDAAGNPLDRPTADRLSVALGDHLTRT